MIKIEVRKDGVYSAGYPYNAPVDEYFKSLTEDFIKNYGLSQAVVDGINQHKNDMAKFDLDIHEFLIKLSAFMIEFENVGHRMINEYDILKAESHTLNTTKENITKKKIQAIEEFTFATNNVDRLRVDVAKIIEIINHYNGKVVEETIVYSDGYIAETQASLALLENLITQTNTNFDYYSDAVRNIANELSGVKREIVDHTFKATSLRLMFEEWQKRPEEYFRKLVAYYQDEYDSYWTYGTSLMFGENTELETAVMLRYNGVSDKWQDELFKKYAFKLEDELKRYSLLWLNNHSSFDPDRFKYEIENKKIDLLMRDIEEVEQLVKQKEQLVRNLLTIEKYENYNKYKEFVMEKRKYVISNITGTISSDVLRDLDIKIAELENDYLYVHDRLSRATYWEVVADKDMYADLLVELNRKLQKSRSLVSGGFVVVPVDNTEVLEKIKFYMDEKALLDKKILDLIAIKDRMEMNLNSYNDELTLLDSRIYENFEAVEQKIAEYTVFFDSRLPFFTQNVTGTEIDAIICLLKGDFYRDFDEKYDVFVKYTHQIKWYSETHRSQLKTLYSKMLELINFNMRAEWEKEFSHEILNKKKHVVYGEYISTELRALFAIMNKHILDELYRDDYIEEVKDRVTNIKGIFLKYVDVGFSINENISVNTNIFDYLELLTFDIKSGEESMSNVVETFFDILDSFVSFAYNKNLEFKNFAIVVDNQQKIDRVWLDMEKKYV